MTQLCFSLHHRNRITKAYVKKLTLQRTLRLSILNISVKIPGLSIDVLSSTMSVIATGNVIEENISDKTTIRYLFVNPYMRTDTIVKRTESSILSSTETGLRLTM